MNTKILKSALPLIFVLFYSLTASILSAQNWPQFRGPMGTGEAPGANPPVEWSETSNIRWKIPLPGLGHASPVVWGDRIFVLTAVPAQSALSTTRRNSYHYQVLAINRRDGSIIWRRTARTEPPHESRHDTASWASPSPVTDGNYVIASFGSRGLYCYDMDGNLKWEKDFGDMRIRYQWGEGASPALADGRVIVAWDHTGRSFIAAFDVRTGNELWRTPRSDGTSWATPAVIEYNGTKQVVASSIRAVRSYGFNTGRELWRTRGMTPNPIPTPLEGNGIVYLTGGYRESVLLAVSLDKSGSILWEYNRDTPYVPTPALYGGILYFVKYNTNMITALDARTGSPHYARERLDGISGIYASPAAAAGRIYFAGRNGTTVVVEHGANFNVLTVNKLPDKFDASPAIAGDELFLRGHEWLWCVGE